MGISQGTVGRIAERIVANEFEARGFRVSDLNKEGVAANADLLAVSTTQTLQVQVKGATNPPKSRWWVGYGHFSAEYIEGETPRWFNRKETFYIANVVVLVAVRSQIEYSCIILPIKVAERAAGLHRDNFRERGWWKGGRTHMSLEPPPRAKETEHIKNERKLLARYRDELGWNKLISN